MMGRLLILLFAVLALAGPAVAQTASPNFNAQQQAEIRALVRNYLVNNPQVLDEALNALAARKQAERVHRAQDDPRDFSTGPANAQVTVVEFFDYRCPYCALALPWVMQTVRTHHDIRFVFKELPIAQLHGEPAIQASRASIAAMPQNHYLQFHQAMLSFRGELTDERIDQLARQSGIDLVRMHRAMNDANVTQLLLDNRALAIDLSGADGGLSTPTFLVNNRVVMGFRDPTELEEAISQARRGPQS
jgi:protein-disulfide isomerase